MRRVGALAACLLVCGCGDAPKPRVSAGRLTAANFDKERVAGPASQGLIGDFYMRNSKLRAVIQAPGRAIGPCPWGGNVIDLDLAETPRGDQLGEVSPFLGLGRTVNFTEIAVTRDGGDGGAAVITARGPDVINDFINIIGIGGFTVAALPKSLSPFISLDLDVTATYTLEPDASHLRVAYAIKNKQAVARKVLFGTLTDTGAAIELFHPGVGYGEFAITDFITGGVPTVEYVTLQGEGLSYGILPVERDPQTRGAPLPVGGVVVEAYDQRSFSDALSEAGQTLAIGPNATATRTVEILVAPGGAGAIESQVRALTGQKTGSVRGILRNGGAGARIAVSRTTVADPAAALTTVYVPDDSGVFFGALQPGEYRAEVEGEGHRRAAPVTFEVVEGRETILSELVLPPAAQLAYRVRDDAGAPIPAKIFVIGALPAVPDRRFRDTVKDPLPYGIAAWWASRAGDSSYDDAWDRPLALAPGHYRVVISRGPEWSRFEKEIDLPASGATVEATLKRVVDTTGYVACDFHQHSHISPDSPVSPEVRVLANLAEGVEYLSSSEHDLLFDYAPVIDALDAGRLIGSGIGVESTPFDYGHFIGWPLAIDPLMPNGGALDWGNGGLGDLTPGQIFGGLRGKGAQVVQVNHPRTPPLNISYQQNFDRAALRFDYASHTFYSDTGKLEVSARDLGLPEDASLFSDQFNATEVYLGFWPAEDVTVIDRERQDVLVNTNLRDWMTFLSFGFTPTAVGDSDTHQRWSWPSGLPRTLVRVPDDSTAGIAAGLGVDVARTMTGAAPRDAIVTNGPMVTLHAGPSADTGGIGRTVALSGGAATVEVHVKASAPDWVPFDSIELYANNAFVIPPPPGQQPEPLIPILCFTARVPASSRCQAAIGGARPLTVSTVDLGGGYKRLEAQVDTTLAVADVQGRVRAGAVGKDFWIVARVAGLVGLYPVIPANVDGKIVPLADLVAGKALRGQGVPALAFTNPVFVDADGGGWRAPFAP
ncbi:MAG TPA: hypothetical protein VMZ28_19880 [Kofleriaceae bacterium]|nr:hypothetical protein [Kofleriaceae bacterium]